MAEDVEHVDFVDFADAYAQNYETCDFSNVVLLFMDDDTEVFGKWSADDNLEYVALEWFVRLQDPVKNCEILASIDFLEKSNNPKSRVRHEKAFLYLTMDSIKSVKIKRLATFSQRTWDLQDLSFADQMCQESSPDVIIPAWLWCHLPDVKDLILENRLHCVRLELTADAPIHAAGLFNQRTYGSQTQTMESLRRKAKQASALNLIFSARSQRASRLYGQLQEALETKGEPWPYGIWFGSHPSKPYLQPEPGHIVPPERRPKTVVPHTRLSFFDVAEYTARLGYGFIAQHEYDDELRRSAKDQKTLIKTLSVPGHGNRNYQIFIKQPTGRIHRPGETGFVQFGEPSRDEDPKSRQDHPQQRQEATDREANDAATSEPVEHVDEWRFYLVEDAPWAPIGYATGYLERPYVNGKFQVATDPALEPVVLSWDSVGSQGLPRALASHPAQAVFVQTEIDRSQFRQVIAANHELYKHINEKEEVWNILLCNDATTTTKVDFFRTVDREACDWSFLNDFSPEQKAAFEGLFHLPALICTLQGPPGSGKSFFTSRSLLPFMQSPNKDTMSQHQALIVTPTNELASKLASEITEVIEQYSRQQDATPAIVIRLHQDKTEEKIALRPAAERRAKRKAPDDPPLDDDSDAIQVLLDETAQVYRTLILGHYDRTARTASGMSDRRVLHAELSLGHRMLQKVGVVEAPWSESNNPKYRTFLTLFDQYMDNKLVSREAMARLKAQTKVLRDDTLRDAAVIVCTPFCAGQYSVRTMVKPTVFFIEEAAQIMEPILWPLLAHYTAPQNETLTAILLVGDHFQLRPIVTCPKESTPFHGQLRISLFSRLTFAGFELKMLQEQRRMHPDIGNLVSALFYQNRLQTHESTHHVHSGRARGLRQWNADFFNRETNLIFVDLKGTSQKQDHRGSSWWNAQNVAVGVALARLLCRHRTKLSIQAQDILILVPYEAQYRLYLSELAKAHLRNTKLDLINVKVDKIDRFQGSESSIVIFDLTVTQRLGFCLEPGRLNVGLSRAKHAMYVLGNKSAMEDAFTPRRQDMRLLKAFLEYLKDHRHIVTNRFLQRHVDDWNKAHGDGLQSAMDVDTQGIESLDQEIQAQAIHSWETTMIEDEMSHD